MKTCWFIIIHSRGAWWVDCEGKSYGPFASPDEAQQEAKRLAEMFGDPSRRSLVFAPNAEGHQELVWTGPDPAAKS
jgi:hypothetical protein